MTVTNIESSTFGTDSRQTLDSKIRALRIDKLKFRPR